MTSNRSSPCFVRRYAGGVIKSPTPSTMPPAAPPLAPPRPQCTHMVMNRLRGEILCDCCNRPSPMGWVYQCTQDLPPYVHQPPAPFSGVDVMDDRQEMIALGVSKSILEQYDAGLYTPDQVEVIKHQKRHIHEVIDRSIHSPPSRRSSAVVPSHNRRVSLGDKHSMAVPHRADLEAPTARPTNTTRAVLYPGVEACRFKCCHRCRPFYRDRLAASFESILDDEEPPVSRSEAATLRVIDAAVLRDLQYKPARIDIYHEKDAVPGFDMLESAPWPLTSSAQTLPLLSDLQDGHYKAASLANSDSFSSPARSTMSGSSISLPITPSTDGSYSRSNSHDFDLGGFQMRKADSWHFSSLDRISRMDFSTMTRENSSEGIGIDNGVRALDVAAGADRRRSVGANSVLTGLSSSGSGSSGYTSSSEIEVEGGVALTEEAVEMGLPDVATDHSLHEMIEGAQQPATQK